MKEYVDSKVYDGNALYVQPVSLGFPLTIEDHPFLSADERRRAAIIRGEEDRARFIVGRVLMRRTLATLTKTPPQDVVLVLGPRGKPQMIVPDPGPAFSLTHTENVVVLAWRLSGAVGVDIEPATRGARMTAAVAARALTHAERAEMADTDISTHSARLLRRWTLKEAIAKATGDGLALGFKTFSLNLGEEGAISTFGNDAPAALRETPWHLFEFKLGAFAGAVAAAGPEMRPPLTLLPVIDAKDVLQA